MIELNKKKFTEDELLQLATISRTVIKIGYNIRHFEIIRRTGGLLVKIHTNTKNSRPVSGKGKLKYAAGDKLIKQYFLSNGSRSIRNMEAIILPFIKV